MAQTISISQKELERLAVLVYEGETLEVMFCQVGLTGYTANDTVANWETIELSGNGYVRYTEVIGTGAWSNVDGAYVLPDIDAEFTSTGYYQYDRVVIFLTGATYPYAVITESPAITLVSGQTQVYRVSLRTDD
jgi:hypothetical protein